MGQVHWLCNKGGAKRGSANAKSEQLQRHARVQQYNLGATRYPVPAHGVPDLNTINCFSLSQFPEEKRQKLSGLLPIILTTSLYTTQETVHTAM